MSIRKANDEVSSQQSKIQGSGSASRRGKGEARYSASKTDALPKSIARPKEGSGRADGGQADNIIDESIVARAEPNLSEAAQPSRDRQRQADSML